MHERTKESIRVAKGTRQQSKLQGGCLNFRHSPILTAYVRCHSLQLAAIPSLMIGLQAPVKPLEAVFQINRISLQPKSKVTRKAPQGAY